MANILRIKSIYNVSEEEHSLEFGVNTYYRVFVYAEQITEAELSEDWAQFYKLQTGDFCWKWKVTKSAGDHALLFDWTFDTGGAHRSLWQALFYALDRLDLYIFDLEEEDEKQQDKQGKTIGIREQFISIDEWDDMYAPLEDEDGFYRQDLTEDELYKAHNEHRVWTHISEFDGDEYHINQYIKQFADGMVVRHLVCQKSYNPLLRIYAIYEESKS